jgi:hypothetical protein
MKNSRRSRSCKMEVVDRCRHGNHASKIFSSRFPHTFTSYGMAPIDCEEDGITKDERGEGVLYNYSGSASLIISDKRLVYVHFKFLILLMNSEMVVSH